MALGTCSAVVIGRFPLGESDRVVTFFSREFGRIRGVAKSARRIRSRFGSALEPFTLGQLVFFDTGRSDLVRIDHFDILRPFDHVRDDLERLGQAAWMAECVARLTAERDVNPLVYGLLLRALRSLESGAPPSRVAVVFGLRCVDALGHRLRIDACVTCRRSAGLRSPVFIDVDLGGLLCASCAADGNATVRVAPATVGVLKRLRGMAWAEATAGRLGPAEAELREVLDAQIERLIGHPTRTSRFLREVSRVGWRAGRP
jgi:DNA repair protein RecO (recombination protein O)